MEPETILEHRNREPFVPFRLKLRNGRTYEVPHPNLLMVGRAALVLGTLDREKGEPLFDHTISIDLANVVDVEVSG